jgi:hypothetical protein
MKAFYNFLGSRLFRREMAFSRMRRPGEGWFATKELAAIEARGCRSILYMRFTAGTLSKSSAVHRHQLIANAALVRTNPEKYVYRAF